MYERNFESFEEGKKMLMKKVRKVTDEIFGSALRKRKEAKSDSINTVDEFVEAAIGQKGGVYEHRPQQKPERKESDVDDFIRQCKN